MTDWLCIGGPIHGQYRPAGRRPIAVRDPDARADYAVTQAGDEAAWEVKVAVAIPPRPALYYAQRIGFGGWAVHVPVWLEATIAAGRANLQSGLVIPGGMAGVLGGAQCVACRWCYGQPMDDHPVCERPACISRYAWLCSLELATADDAKGWNGEQS